MNIVEFIISGPSFKVTPDSCRHSRLRRPSPGDAVDFGHMLGTYPFTSGRYGVIESIGGGMANDNEAHVCCGGASVFMGDGYLSISGGPFECIPLDRLVWEGAFKTQWFWNWGSLGAGAGHACHFALQRPVWTLLPAAWDRHDHPLPKKYEAQPEPHEVLAALAWCIRQMQGESGASDDYWSDHPEYIHACQLLRNHERIPPAAQGDAVPGEG